MLSRLRDTHRSTGLHKCPHSPASRPARSPAVDRDGGSLAKNASSARRCRRNMEHILLVRAWRSPGVVSSSRAPEDATRCASPAPFKGADQSSYRRVLPLNYRARKRRRPDSNQHPTVFVRNRSIRQSVAMLNLERESECDHGCLCRVGLPRRVVPGEGLEPSL